MRVWSPVSGSGTWGPHRKMPAATLLVVSGLHLSDTILTWASHSSLVSTTTSSTNLGLGSLLLQHDCGCEPHHTAPNNANIGPAHRSHQQRCLLLLSSAQLSISICICCEVVWHRTCITGNHCSKSIFDSWKLDLPKNNYFQDIWDI